MSNSRPLELPSTTRSNPCSSFFNYAYKTTSNFIFNQLKKTEFFGAAITMSKEDGTGVSEVITDAHEKSLINPKGFHQFNIGPFPAIYVRKINHIHALYIKKPIQINPHLGSKQKGASSYDKTGVYTVLFGKDNILVLPTTHEKYTPQREFLNEQLLSPDMLIENAPLMLNIINRHLNTIDNKIDDLEHFLNHLIIDLVMEIQLGIIDLSYEEKEYFISLAARATPHIANLASIVYSKLNLPTELNAMIKEGKEIILKIIARNEKNISATNNFINNWRKAKLDYMTIENLFALVLFASYKSTTEGMLFTLMLLADTNHAEITKKLATEIREVFSEEKVSKEKVDKIKYLDWTVRESLRLYPPFPIFKDELAEDVLLDGVEIKKGTTVFFSALRYHRQEDAFGLSANKFNPRAGLSEVEDTPIFITFGSKPRTCPGRNDSMLKIRLLVTLVLLRGDIKIENADLHHPYPVIEKFSLHLSPTAGKVRISITPVAELECKVKESESLRRR